MALSKLSKKIIHIGSITTAITVIVGALGWVYNEYKDHKRNSEEELKRTIIKLIEENSKLDSLNNRIRNIEGDGMFAVGFRSDGENLYYRDIYGEIHEVFYDQEYDIYYYMDNGEFVYITI